MAFCLNDGCEFTVSSECVFYESTALPYIGINTNDSLEMALQKIEDIIANGIASNATWGLITGNIGDQTDLIDYLANNYVPQARILTINGTSFDLSADRTWSVGTVTSIAALTIGTTGTNINSSVANPTTTPVITLNVPTASAINRGALSSSDWSTFNSKLSSLTNGNGTTANGSSVDIGGTLINNTIINGDNNNFEIGQSGDEVFNFRVYSANQISGSATNGIALTSGSSAFTLGTVSGSQLSFGSNQLLINSIGSTFTGKTIFTPTVSIAGMNWGSVAVDPSTPVDGDTWYRSDLDQFSGRANGSTFRFITTILQQNTTINGAFSFSLAPTNLNLNPTTQLDVTTVNISMTAVGGSFSTNASNNINIIAGNTYTMEGDAGILLQSDAGSVFLETNSINRLQISNNGAWLVGGSGGSSGQALISNGGATPPTWQNISSSLTATQVGYGSGANTLTGESAFTYNDSTNTLSVENITNLTGAQTLILSSLSLFLQATGTGVTGNLQLSTSGVGGDISINSNDNILINAATGILLITGGSGVPDLQINPNHSWELFGDTGASGEALVSNGAGSAPTWQTISAGNLSGTLTSGRVPFATGANTLADDADLTFSGSTLSATNISISSLTSGRIPIISTGGSIIDDSDLTFINGDELHSTEIYISEGRIFSTSYTPTAVGVTNITTIAPSLAIVTQVGENIIISGAVVFTATSPLTATRFTLSLPAISPTSNEIYGIGQCTIPHTIDASSIQGSGSNTAQFDFFFSGGSGGEILTYVFQYKP